MINVAGVSHEYGDAIAQLTFGDEDGLLWYFNKEQRCLEFRAEVTSGEFEDLETFLRENDIPYNRRSACYGGFTGEDVYWVPGMAKPLEISCDDHGRDLVPMEEVRAVLQGLDRRRSISVHLESVRRQLEVLCPNRPEIPPFKIVGEKA